MVDFSLFARRSVRGALAASVAAMALHGAASAQDGRRIDFNIEVQPLATALLDYARHAGPGYQLKGMVNLPLVEDKLAVRAVATYRDQPGYIDNVGVGVRGSNSMETLSGGL